MAAETSKKKSGRIGQVRCQSSFERFWPAPGVEEASCPNCGWEWYISWSGELAKIRKPVWERWEQSLAEAQQSVDSSQ